MSEYGDGSSMSVSEVDSRAGYLLQMSDCSLSDVIDSSDAKERVAAAQETKIPLNECEEQKRASERESGRKRKEGLNRRWVGRYGKEKGREGKLIATG